MRECRKQHLLVVLPQMLQRIFLYKITKTENSYRIRNSLIHGYVCIRMKLYCEYGVLWEQIQRDLWLWRWQHPNPVCHLFSNQFIGIILRERFQEEETHKKCNLTLNSLLTFAMLTVVESLRAPTAFRKLWKVDMERWSVSEKSLWLFRRDWGRRRRPSLVYFF